jgi:hypothetical protein
MSTRFTIESTDSSLLQKATRVASEFAQQYIRDEVVGIVLLGAVARGYFDSSADIDVAVFKRQASETPSIKKFIEVEGLEVHCWLSEYEDELAAPWDMAKRWTFSQVQMFYDPRGDISRLLEEKAPLKPEEKKWLLMSGLVLSEWYVNRLTRLWVKRGSIISAHHMFNQGLDYFSNMLFALNNSLVPDMKWRYYCLEQLPILPHGFLEGIRNIMTLHLFSMEELERRQGAFMEIWQEMKPLVEGEVHMTFDEMKQVV